MSIAINADLIAEFPACELVTGHAISLTRQIHQRHLHTAHTATLPRMPPELFDLAKQLIHITGIFTQKLAFQLQSVNMTGTIAHLSQTINTLIGIQANERRAHRHTGKTDNAHIGNSEI